MKGEYVIRFALCAEKASEDDVYAAWSIIQEVATDVLAAESTEQKPQILKCLPKLGTEETTHCA